MQSDLLPSKGKEEANMNDILAELESSESVYFQEKFTRSLSDNVQLELPMRFVEEHGYKMDKWVILRARTFWGTSSRPWAAQLKMYKKMDGTREVRFVDGWEAFATHNQLQEGDALIFLLRDGARSEFEVYVFREIGGSFSLLDLCDSSSDEEFLTDSEKNNINLSTSDSENNIIPSPSPGLSHHQDESIATTITGNNSSEGHAPGFQITEHLENHSAFPRFQKRLTACNFQHSNRGPNSGSFEFPPKFVSTYGRHFQPSIQLQGVYEESPVYPVSCRRYKGKDAEQNENFRLGIKEHDWSAFVKENHLQKGQKLQFSLTADSYFVVRKV